MGEGGRVMGIMGAERDGGGGGGSWGALGGPRRDPSLCPLRLKRRSEEGGDRWAARDPERRFGLQRWMRDLRNAVRPLAAR